MTKGKQIVSFIFVLLLIPIGWNGINQVSGQNRKRPPRNNSLDRHDRAKPIVVHLRVGSDSVEVLEAVPDVESGKDLKSYKSAFRRFRLPSENGTITLRITSTPLIVTEIREQRAGRDDRNIRADNTD